MKSALFLIVFLFSSTAIAGPLLDPISHPMDQPGSTPDAWKKFCDYLNSISIEELAALDMEIRDPEWGKDLDCKKPLIVKLDSYWEARRTALHQFRGAEDFDDYAQPNPARVVPSVEKPLDIKSTPVFHSGNHGGLEQGQIALTFDDGPSFLYTPTILTVLHNSGVRATFFEVGQMAAKHPGLSKQVADAGHSVGSHTWSHQQLDKLPFDSAVTEIDNGRKSVIDHSGAFFPFFRFPYGHYDSQLVQYVQSQELATFFWDMDSRDWNYTDPVQVYQNILTEWNRAHYGIILFHDVHMQTTIVVPNFLDEMRKRGFVSAVYEVSP